MPSTSPVFVIGCPRSGTTLLTLMLSSHSRIAIPPETRFMLPVFREHRVFGDLAVRRNRRRLARRIVRGQGSRFSHLGLDRSRVVKEIVAGAPTIGSALAAPFRVYAQERGKARWGNKRPGQVHNVAVILTLFPDAQMVHLVRDPRDCVASLARVSWWAGGAVEATATWVHAVDAAEAARRTLPDDAFHELRYEDLVSDPRAELERLCGFLGESFEEAMLTPQAEAALLPARQRADWHRETQREVGPRRIGSHSGVLSSQQVALIESVAGTRMWRYGYEVPVPGHVPRRLRLAYWRTIALMKVKSRVRAARDRRLVRPAGSVAAR
jgi:hypothetical protein